MHSRFFLTPPENPIEFGRKKLNELQTALAEEEKFKIPANFLLQNLSAFPEELCVITFGYLNTIDILKQKIETTANEIAKLEKIREELYVEPQLGR